MLCRHCHKKKVNRPLGLCWGCYYRPGVRALYPSTSKFCTHKPEEDREQKEQAGKKPPHNPTRCPPGSAGKVKVLQRRAERGEGLWHRLDAQADGPAPLCFSLLGELV